MREHILNLCDRYFCEIVNEEYPNVDHLISELIPLASDATEDDYHFTYRVALALGNITSSDHRHAPIAKEYFERLLTPRYEPYFVGFRDIVLAHIYIKLSEINIILGDCSKAREYFHAAIAEGTRYIGQDIGVVRGLYDAHCQSSSTSLEETDISDA